MRKYALPKYIYIGVALMLIVLSVGYTYAYFSAIATANAGLTLGKIDIVWRDANYNSSISAEFEDSSSIAISSTLKRGQYIPLKSVIEKGAQKGKEVDLRLQISNVNGTVGAYCRLKITATYQATDAQGNAVGEVFTCDDGWVQLALDNTFITDLDVNGWVFQDGYYYYGYLDGDDLKLNTLAKLQAQLVVNQIYLSTDADATILGAKAKITLTLEGVQTTNGAYKSVWELPEDTNIVG